jgi:hypothetical protein
MRNGEFGIRNGKSNSAIRILKSALGYGDVAQRESTCLARRGSAVQIRSSPPKEMGESWVPIEILEPVVSGILD